MNKITKTIEGLDVECFPNWFFLGVENYETNDKYGFELSENINQLFQLYEWWKSKNTKLYKHYDFIVSFNGIHYDNLIINYIIKSLDNNLFDNLTNLEICEKIKQFSDHVIYCSRNEIHNDGLIKSHKYYHKWTDLDLYMYFAKLLRISKKISLKGLAIQLNYPEIQELPYSPDTVLNIEQIGVVKLYNLKNDLGILKALYTKMLPDIKLRQMIHFDEKINSWSMDAPKIASEILCRDYCTQKELNYYEFNKTRFEANPLIKVKDLISDVKFTWLNPQLKQVYEEILESTASTFEKTFVFKIHKTALKISLGKGGIHSLGSNVEYKSTGDFIIVSSDVASLYPTVIDEYECIRFLEVLQKYRNIKKERLIIKRIGPKIKDLFLKLILNGISGIIDNAHSPLYYNEGALRLRMLGQLIMLQALDKVSDYPSFNVIALNT